MATLTTSTPAILVHLGKWRLDADLELPRQSYGYRPGMSETELRDSARAWWHLSRSSAAGYDHLAAVHDGFVVGVWTIDHESWRRASRETCERLGTSDSRWGVEVGPASPDVTAAFNGRQIPAQRPNGRRVFGSGSVVAYWPG
jgi:hypothetical protein